MSTQPEMFKSYLENRIVGRGDNYKCYVCHIQIPQHESLQEHFTNQLHQTKLSMIDKQVRSSQSELLSTISSKKHRKLVMNRITLDRQPHSFHCCVCKCKVSGLPNILEHIEGTKHKEAITLNINQKVDEKVVCKKAPKTDATDCTNIESIDKIPKCLTRRSDNKFECQLCSCTVTGGSKNIFEHIRGFVHRSNRETMQLQNKKQINTHENITNDAIKKKPFQTSVSTVMYCRLCPEVLRTHSILQSHALQHLHSEIDFILQPDIVIFARDTNSKPIIQCSLCQMTLSNYAHLEKHFKSTKHVERLAHFTHLRDDLKRVDFCKSGIEEIILNGFKFEPSNHFINSSFCDACNVLVPLAGEDQHVKGKKHKTESAKVALRTANSQKRIEPFFNLDSIYPCYVCNSSYSDVEELLNHYNEFEHRCKMTNFYKVQQDSSVNFYEVNGKTVLNCNSCHANEMLSLRVAVDHILGRRHNSGNDQSSTSQTGTLIQNNHTTNCEEKDRLKILKDESQSRGFGYADRMTNSNSGEGPKNLNLGSNVTSITQNTQSISTKILKPTCRRPKSNEFQSTLDELVALGFSEQSALLGSGSQETQSTKVDGILSGLIDLNLGEKEDRRLPLLNKQKKARIPDFSRKMNILAQNVEYFGKSYIDYCIYPGGKYIYKRNAERIRLAHLGISLTFPHNASLRYCPVCPGTFPADQQSLFEHVQNSTHRKNLQKYEADHTLFEDYSDQFSDLRLAKQYMQEESDDWIHCHACNVRVANKDFEILLHNESMSHVKKSEEWSKEANAFSEEFSTILKDIWYYAQWFTCAICKKKFDFEIEFASHLETKSHVEQVRKSEQKKIPLEFDVCHICSLFWYGQSDFYDQHCGDSFHSCCVKSGDFIVPKMGLGTVNLIQNFETVANNSVEESDKVRLENNKELELLQIIQETVRSQYPKAKAHAFGSRVSHLATSDTDLDVFLDCEDNYKNNTTQKKSQQYLISVQKLFESNVNCWIVDELLLSTRVPIMKLRHIPTNIKCDISFMNGLSVEKSKLLRYYCEAYPLCRKLILYLKKWFTFCHLSGSDRITTFAISWLVIFYLQVKNMVPDVNYLLKNGRESKVVDGWECGFLVDLPMDHATELTFKDHLRAFFNYYANFDYQTFVLCPLLGEAISKDIFAYHEELPEEMTSYKRRVLSDKSMIFRIDSSMGLQDPLDLSQNITKAVKKYHLRCFRQYCSESVSILSSL